MSLLTPNSKIKTNETGTRHKAAERTAKQAGTLAVAISERKNEITIYYKDIRYPLNSHRRIFEKSKRASSASLKNKEIYLIIILKN